jgi:hypothetical protein
VIGTLVALCFEHEAVEVDVAKEVKAEVAAVA